MVWEGDYMVHANTTKQSGPIRWVCFPPLKFMGWMGLCPWQGGSKADGREICRETKSPTMYQTWWGWYKLNAAWYLEETQMNDPLIQLWPKYGFSEPGYHPPSPNEHTHTHTQTNTILVLERDPKWVSWPQWISRPPNTLYHSNTHFT